jgi:nuclear pore complex protein Nup62
MCIPWFYVMTFNTCSHLSIERIISLTFLFCTLHCLHNISFFLSVIKPNGVCWKSTCYGRLHVRTCLCANVCMYLCIMYVYMYYVCMCVCVYVCVYVYVCMYVCIMYIYIYIMYVPMYTYVWSYVCMYVPRYVWRPIYVCTYVSSPPVQHTQLNFVWRTSAKSWRLFCPASIHYSRYCTRLQTQHYMWTLLYSGRWLVKSGINYPTFRRT